MQERGNRPNEHVCPHQTRCVASSTRQSQGRANRIETLHTAFGQGAADWKQRRTCAGYLQRWLRRFPFHGPVLRQIENEILLKAHKETRVKPRNENVDLCTMSHWLYSSVPRRTCPWRRAWIFRFMCSIPAKLKPKVSFNDSI